MLRVAGFGGHPCVGNKRDALPHTDTRNVNFIEFRFHCRCRECVLMHACGNMSDTCNCVRPNGAPPDRLDVTRNVRIRIGALVLVNGADQHKELPRCAHHLEPNAHTPT